jgi:hypothetical protein
MPSPRRTIPRLAVLLLLLAAETAFSREAGFDPRVITFGETRDQIKSTPITDRPNRPLHVYGNSVRRRQHRAAPRR